MPECPDYDDAAILAVLTANESTARKREREIWGRRRRLPNDEFAIAFNFNISHEEKMKQLTALRSAKAAKRAARKPTPISMQKSFAERLSVCDTFHARSLGIELEDRDV